MQYYKVTNTAIIPCHMEWNKALLTDEELARYEAYKESPDYVGYDQEDRVAKGELAEAIKMRAFYDTLGHDVKIKVFDNVGRGRQPRYEWRFVIGPDVAKLKKQDDLSETRRICEEYEVEVKRDDTVAQLADKLAEKFGENVKVLTEVQWLESGLRAREYREIKLRLRPGETTQRIQTEGYLKAVPMADVEYEEYLSKKESHEPKGKTS